MLSNGRFWKHRIEHTEILQIEVIIDNNNYNTHRRDKMTTDESGFFLTCSRVFLKVYWLGANTELQYCAHMMDLAKLNSAPTDLTVTAT